MINIAMIDDHPLVRHGIATVLSLEKGINIVAEAAQVADGLNVIKEFQPDIVLVDLKLRKESGLDIICACKKEGLQCKFIILTSYAGQEEFRKVGELGVHGYVLKEALPEELILAIRLVHHGRRYFDPEIIDLLMKEEEDPMNELTRREKEILKTLGQGLNNRDIAKRLYITEYTVKKHVSQILAKLDLADRTQAAIYANKRSL
ncbi:response regulator transcription factor [Paradesulfitobacterium aromaticivorans]